MKKLIATCALVVVAYSAMPKPAPSPADPVVCAATVGAQLMHWVWHKAEEGVAVVVGWVVSRDMGDGSR